MDAADGIVGDAAVVVDGIAVGAAVAAAIEIAAAEIAAARANTKRPAPALSVETKNAPALCEGVSLF